MSLQPINVADLKPALKPILVTNEEGLAQVQDYLSHVTEFGFDVETNVTKTFFPRKLRTIQIGDRNEQYVIDLLHFAGSTEELKQQGHYKAPAWAEPIVKTLKPALESKSHLKLGQNIQFDYETTKWCLGIRSQHFYDTLLAEKALWAGLVRFDAKNFWGLEDLVARYCKLKIDKTFQSGFDLENPLDWDRVVYAALDTRLLFAIRAGQMPKIEKAGLVSTLFDVEFPAIMAFGDMHLNGFELSVQKWLKQVEETTKKNQENIAELDKYFIPVVGDKAPPSIDLEALEQQWKLEKDKERRATLKETFYAQRRIVSAWKKELPKYQGNAAINYGSPTQLLKALTKMGVDLPNTNDATLELIDHPVIESLRNYRTTDKLLDTYGVSFVDKYVDADTGRIHSKIDQYGAETGRTTSSAPNIQNIPQEEAYRSSFVARAGYVLITRDYDGCELRFMAEASGEESWINAFNNGQDVHSMCAELMYGDVWKNAAEKDCAYYAAGKKCSCKGHKKLRNGAKAINFGIPYGKGYKKLARELHISDDEAKALLALHKERFPKVHKYLADSADSGKRNLECRTPGGRRRLFEQPDWNKAKEKAQKQFEEDGKDPRLVSAFHIGKAYYGMWGSIERESKNTPIQGANADLSKRAMAMAWPELEPRFGAVFCNIVHDELIVECPKETAEECNKFLAQMMLDAGKPYVKRVQMVSTGAIEEHWTK